MPPLTSGKETRVVVNATHLGRKLDGIGVYTLSLLRGLSRAKTNMECLVVLNRNAAEHVRDIDFPENIRIRWTTRRISPDQGFMGNLFRFIYSNLLPLLYRNTLIFDVSQQEASLFHHRQVITVHDIIPLLFPAEHRMQYYFFKYFLKRALRLAAAIITTTNHTRDLLGSVYGIPARRVSVIPLAAQDIYHGDVAADQERDNFILYSGRAKGHKNIRGLLEAFNLIKAKTDHKLVIVGNAEERLVSGYRAEGLLDDGRVTFTGYISSEELRDYYRKARLFVWPSFCEGFGLPPLEAMTCGCPVVASNQARMLDVLGDAAVYVDPHNPESIADGMYRVLTDASLRDDLARKGLIRAKMFSWDNTTREHIRLLEQVLG